ncbi:MAG: crossover junction endodeoxyribonuclease RuvC [Armatimonadetes bacterium]|nr:crossover junction endodeoxyribonuclease RuvC [Armatimonadota bacterium]
MPRTILGIDPGTKEMGAALIRGRELIAFGVHTLRNGSRPRDIIDQARRIVLSYIREYIPAIVGIEKPLLFPTKRAALVSVIVQELRARSHELGLGVLELSARQARQIVVGDPNARKLDVAQAIVGMGFEDLRSKLPKEPPHPVLGYKSRDRYWLHMFDALAIALAIEKRFIHKMH